MTKMGREQQHAPSIQHIQILWNKKKNFFQRSQNKPALALFQIRILYKVKKKLLKALSMCYSF